MTFFDSSETLKVRASLARFVNTLCSARMFGCARNYSKLIPSSCFKWGLWEKCLWQEWWSTHFAWKDHMTEHLYLNGSLYYFYWGLWSMHFAWNSDKAVYSSFCTLVHGQTCWWFTPDKSAGGLRAPFFWPMRASTIHRAQNGGQIHTQGFL